MHTSYKTAVTMSTHKNTMDRRASGKCHLTYDSDWTAFVACENLRYLTDIIIIIIIIIIIYHPRSGVISTFAIISLYMYATW